MNNKYVVTKAFKDKITFDNYLAGSYYMSDSEDRINELLRGGFIAAEESQEAKAILQGNTEASSA